MDEDPAANHPEDAARMISDHVQILSIEEYDEEAAKQRASVLWLLSKAYMPKIPPELSEPCYLDHKGNERLKPQIVHALANAELYCLALANIYADPNYHNLNHHGILQVLMRKGIDVVEPADATLTETVLVQTAPIRMSAHMSVIEGIMELFVKEVLIPEKVMEVVRRFIEVDVESEYPYDNQEAALLWINKSAIKFRYRLEEQRGGFRSSGDRESSLERRPSTPVILLAQDLRDLSDGCCLAALLCLYCPKLLNVEKFIMKDPMSLADSLHNLQQVQQFCQKHLPQDIYFLTLEDMIYLHDSIIPNVLTLIADLMYIFEIRPPKHISRPMMRDDVKVCDDFTYINHNGERQSSPLPNYCGQNISDPAVQSDRNAMDEPQGNSPLSSSSWKKLQKSPSLSGKKFSEEMKTEDIEQDEQSISPERSNREATSQSNHTDDEELAGYFTSNMSLLEQANNQRARVGRSNNESNSPVQTHYKVFHATNPIAKTANQETRPGLKKSPSSYEIHQLSPSKQNVVKTPGYPRQRSQSEVDIPSGKKYGSPNSIGRQISENVFHEQEEAQPQEKSSGGKKTRNSFHEIPRHGSHRENEKFVRQVPRRNNSDFFLHEGRDIETRSSRLSGSQTWRKPKDLFARTEFEEEHDSLESNNKKSLDNEQDSTLSFAKLSKQKNDSSSAINVNYLQHEKDQHSGTFKKPTRPGYLHISASQKNIPENLPSSGTKVNNWIPDNSKAETGEVDATIAAHMLDIHLQLEEKRKKIEQEKLRLEAMTKRQREKMGKAAFLQAVRTHSFDQSNKNLSVEDLSDDLDSVRRKWLEKQSTGQDPETGVENLESESPSEEFQNSIEQLNSSLTDLQSDISKLTQQQEMIQKILSGSQATQKAEPYFLHDSNAGQQQQQPHRDSRWAEPVHHSGHPYPQHPEPPQPSQEVPHVGRGHWGQPVIPFANLQPNHPMHNTPSWQHPSPMYPGRPSSVEPHLMGGQPMNVPLQMYDQNQTGLPYSSPGFALHPQQPTHQPNYSMTAHMNEQPPVFYPGQYSLTPGPYNMYQQQQRPGYGLMQNAYSTTVPNSQSQVQYQSTGFHLHRSPSANYVTSREFANSPSQANQLFIPPRGESNIPKSQSKSDIPHYSQDSNNAMDEFARPLKNTNMQHSPPNKPVLGKTFRVAKAKVTSPSSPSPNVNSSFAQDTNEEQMEAPSQPSPSPCADTSSEAPVDKGFYISFDEADIPRKPKPKLKPKHLKARSQQKKLEEQKRSGFDYIGDSSKDNQHTFPEQSTVPSQKWNAEDAQESANSDETVSREEGGKANTDSAAVSKAPGVGFVIGTVSAEPDPDKEMEMTRRKEMIMMMSLRRRAEQEAKRNEKQQEYLKKKEEERLKEEQMERKKEEERLRRQLILEQYRQRKAAKEEDGTSGGRDDHHLPPRNSTISRPKSRSASVTRHSKPKSSQSSSGRPQDLSSPSSLGSPVGRGSQYNLSSGYPDDLSSEHSYTPSPRRSQHYPHSSPISPSSYPSSPGPLLPGLLSAGSRSRGTPSDGLSDTSSTISSAWASEYSGPKLFVKPTTKSNKGIITNAVNTVLAGAVNSETKRKVLEEIEQSEGKHFLILFRDAGCQFRALYSYNPETEEVIKLYGIGPRVVTNKMMDRFYKYNSGGKSFTQIHTKHLTATIDAFTIQNSLWQSKKVTAYKKDYL